jgi:photosystem II stability/assembly factor-like uncharacterized protein
LPRDRQGIRILLGAVASDRGPFMRPVRLPLAAALAALVFAPAAHAVDLRNFDDAPLRAVQFVDAREGWAAGDDGVVWHTIDGGKEWERQSTGVRASLRSIHFLNPYVGWIAGRDELPGGQSSGVLLFTSDGGVHWQRVLGDCVPGLNFVRFVDEQTGYLAGDGSEQYPGGVFVTTNGGKNWQPVAGQRSPSWLAGAFGTSGGALAGAWSRLALLKPDRFSMADIEGIAGRALRGVHFQGKRGVAVGQGGVILLNHGTGAGEWSYAEAEDTGMPLDVRQSWDFHAVHGAAGHYWAVGRPGSAVLHSRDNGDHWEVQYTHQPLPLNGVFFLDERTGWAVGEFGTVLATTDGGRNWRVQRRGGERAAVLFVHARAAGVPLDAVALLGGQEGYLTAGVRVVGPDSATAPPARCADADRLAAAWRQAGGASAEMLWQFPLGAHAVRAGRDEMLRTWDQLHAGKAADNLLRQMVLALRMWRPDVVITDSPDLTSTGFPSDGVTSEAVREALRRAADPKEFPEHANFLGLSPWQPTKVYARWEGRTEAEVRIDLTQVSAPLRATPQEFAYAATDLLGEGAAPPPPVRNFRFLGGVEGTQKHTDLMQGVKATPVGVSRRPLPEHRELSAEEKKAVTQRATLRALGETRPSALNPPERLVGQMGTMLGDMPDDMAGRAAFAVANQFARNGQWPLAAETYQLLVERYPAHPLTAEACRWLIRHNASSEVKRRYELRQFVTVGAHEYGQKGLGSLQPTGPDALVKRVKMDVPKIEDVHDSETFYNQATARQWYRGPLEVEKRLAAFGPLFVNEPATQFCLQAARRQLGEVEAARQWYADFAAKQPDGPWRAAALAELWLLNRNGVPPKPVAACRFTDTRPFLDGKLDDVCWQRAAVHRMWVASGDPKKAPPPEDRDLRKETFEKYQVPAETKQFLCDYPTEVRLAHDAEYLYVAVRCFHPPEKQIEPAKGRTRDADLRPFDRVSILLDLDRDYSTCYHLQIDQRGCVAEDCWGDRSWDPRWFVTVKSEPTVWVAEAAIPLGALTGDPVPPGRAWAFNAVRVLPGRGVQAWSLPAEVPEESPRPEGMGLIIFTEDQPPKAR